MPIDPVHIQGLKELNRAFVLAGKQTRREIRLEMAAVAEPVRQTAQQLALEKIPRMKFSPEWSVMRVGVTQTSVYVAPYERGVKMRGREKRRRANLFDLLLGRALEPALALNRAGVEAGFGRALDRIASGWSGGFVEIDPHFRG